MENLEVLDRRFVLLWDSSVAVHIHDPASRDSNPGPTSLVRDHLTEAVTSGVQPGLLGDINSLKTLVKRLLNFMDYFKFEYD